MKLGTSRPRLLGPFSLAVREMSAASRPAEVIDILRRATRALTGARGVTVVAREGGLCHYLADDSESALWPDQRFPMEACISGWAMLNGAPAVIPDIYADDRIPHAVYRATFVRSLVMMPIGEGPAFAAFGAYWPEVRRHGKEDLEVLETLAACAAGAFERIWLSQQLREQGQNDEPFPETEVLADVLRREAEALLQQRESQLADALRRLNAIVDNATVAIFLMDEQQQCAYMNAAAEALTGYSLQETLGRPLHDVVHHTRPDGSHYPLAECPIDRAFPERAQTQGEEVFVHKDGSFYPVAFTASPILDETSRTIGTIIEVQDIRARKAEEQHRELLMREVDHRARNVLAVVQSIVRLTDQPTPEAFKDIVARRIEALARAQKTLADSSWQGAHLHQLLRDEIASLSVTERVVIEGPDLFLRGDQVQALCMLVHELATNAVKHGGLSSREGAIRITIETADGRLSALTWAESGGPAIPAPPAREGFGSRLIRQLVRQLGGDLEMDWNPKGLVVRLGLARSPADPA